MVADLGRAGAMRNTTVVSAPEGCGLGERYAALCSALSMGEKVRDQGGHSFVVLDDISCMVSLLNLPQLPNFTIPPARVAQLPQSSRQRAITHVHLHASTQGM